MYCIDASKVSCLTPNLSITGLGVTLYQLSRMHDVYVKLRIQIKSKISRHYLQYTQLSLVWYARIAQNRKVFPTYSFHFPVKYRSFELEFLENSSQLFHKNFIRHKILRKALSSFILERPKLLQSNLSSQISLFY